MAIVQSNFTRWVTEFGAQRLASALDAAGPRIGCRPGEVHRWLRGEREPRPPRVREMVRLAQGRMSFADVHQHFAQRSVR